MRSKRELESAYRSAVILTEQVLSRVDPAGAAGVPDEYAAEAERILSRARDTKDVEGLTQVVMGVFDEQFGKGVCSRQKARDIAQQIVVVVHRLHG